MSIVIHWHHLILLTGLVLGLLVFREFAKPPDSYGIGGMIGFFCGIIIFLLSASLWLFLKYMGWT